MDEQNIDFETRTQASSIGHRSSSLLIRSQKLQKSPYTNRREEAHAYQPRNENESWSIKRFLSLRGSQTYRTLERREPRRLRKKSFNKSDHPAWLFARELSIYLFIYLLTQISRVTPDLSCWGHGKVAMSGYNVEDVLTGGISFDKFLSSLWSLTFTWGARFDKTRIRIIPAHWCFRPKCKSR